MTINIRYCGGCNPRYDRAEVARRLEEEFPLNTYLVNSREDADAVVILCGCKTACVDVTESYGVYGRFILWNESAWQELCSFIKSVEEKESCI